MAATTIALYGRNGQKDVCFSRMLKQSASRVLTSFRSSTGTRPPHHSAARTELVLLIRRTVRPRGYASGLHSLRPCLRNGASWCAGVGRVRSLVFLSILREYYALGLACAGHRTSALLNGFSVAARFLDAHRRFVE
jgi:hypothetical protein